ncbi:hypothetical protein KH5H1_51550 [Corallococcus caeni]|uniref:Secreted protein n=1 Tax=Corallococcus caeni TaxID=3082388 RepID=A0ABQ6QK84_9BACT|nr:hypothetical protein KH5H1_51550 [Corallococcus sp. KH5-1]GMU04094.1 hypothetical protein ASNO1_03460 [Corallococcus sp. NO1]
MFPWIRVAGALRTSIARMCHPSAVLDVRPFFACAREVPGPPLRWKGGPFHVQREARYGTRSHASCQAMPVPGA